MSAYNKWRDWADHKVCCDYSLHMAITYWNEDVSRAMAQVASVDGAGINSFKVFMAYKDVFMLRDNEILECMKTCRSIGGITQVNKSETSLCNLLSTVN